MHRPLVRAPVRSVAEYLCKSKQSLLLLGRRNVAENLGFYRALMTTKGVEFLANGTESTTRSLQMKIVDSLHLGERSKASNLLLDLGHGNHSLRPDDFVHILNYCARSPDPLFVMETWRLMEEREIGVDKLCYFLIIQALCKGGYLEEALNLMNFFEEKHGIYPILSVCNSFLRACAKMRSIIHANQCLDLMEHRMMGKNEVTYSELLKFAVWQQNLSAVHEIWEDYIKHYSFSIIPLRKFIWSYTRLGDLKSAYKTLQNMVALALRGSIFVNRTAEGKLYSSRLDIPIPSNEALGSMKFDLQGNEQSIPSVYCKKFNSFPSNIEQCNPSMENSEADNGISMLRKSETMPVTKILRWSFNDVIHACAHARNCGLAEQLILQLKVMQQRNLKPYDSTLATLSMDCSKALELNLAESLLDQITESPYPYPYNACLAACDRLDQPERAVQILAKMKHLKILPDIRTYELLFSLFGNVNAPYEEGNMLSQVDAGKRINAIEMDMAKNGFQHSHLSMKNLLIALGAEGMIRELIQYLQVAENLFCRNNTFLGTAIYNTVLHSFVEAKESDMAVEIFKNMKSCGFAPDAATYNIMIDCCSILRCFKSACSLVSMMVRDGFYPQTLTYTALIKILLEDENFDEALNLLDQAFSEGHDLDVLLFNTILRKACERGRIDVIEFIVERMHQEKIQPDSSTCHYVFSAYVDQGFHSTAVEALQVLSMRMLSEEDGTHHEKTQFEDDFILAEDSEAESRILQLFKNSEENVAVALLNLRWCAILGFSTCWSPDQSPWAIRLARNYDTRIGN
ncbi:pentatricopeptide repeat-containing protein At1g76280 isoform X3 [Juglans microcarpa x Juglans regia]|uniref:pentatricopeptide repeat-containing protein At1g76280 isoform X3 n=1 Tax=Juglans microcarpa x Juglans regia TaxID=2249226 RepID=UPI001B7F5145|nr:pentatricopeptide repeat-containing protein At1g76280 isoform X3 [Juglans microcarpa x Juglans regia]